MESRHIGPAKLHSSDPLRASNVINFGMTISITVQHNMSFTGFLT